MIWWLCSDLRAKYCYSKVQLYAHAIKAYWEQKHLLPLPGIESQHLGCQATSLYQICTLGWNKCWYLSLILYHWQSVSTLVLGDTSLLSGILISNYSYSGRYGHSHTNVNHKTFSNNSRLNVETDTGNDLQTTIYMVPSYMVSDPENPYYFNLLLKCHCQLQSHFSHLFNKNSLLCPFLICNRKLTCSFCTKSLLCTLNYWAHCLIWGGVVFWTSWATHLFTLDKKELQHSNIIHASTPSSTKLVTTLLK